MNAFVNISVTSLYNFYFFKYYYYIIDVVVLSMDASGKLNKKSG